MRTALSVLVALALTLPASGLSQEEIPLLTWQAPPYWSPPPPPVEPSAPESRPPAESSRTALASSSPLPFVAMTPCRQYDSRTPPAPLFQNTPRTVAIVGAPCSIPVGAQAVSVNITIMGIVGATGTVAVFKVGPDSTHLIAWINYPVTELQRGNAGTTSLSGAGDIVVLVNQGGGSLNFTVDVNGYYAPTGIVNSVNALSGDVTLAEGANVTISKTGQTLTIAASGGGGGGTVTSVSTGAGLTGGPITTTGTVSVASGGVTSSMIATGAVGLSQIDPTQVQARGTSTCPAGSTIQTINADGSVVCAVNPVLSTGFSLSTLDSADDVGRYTSITIGSDGVGLISYYDNSNHDLKVAHCSNVNCTAATFSTLDSVGDVGWHTSITIGSDGLGLISYHDATNHDLKVAHCSDVNCSTVTLSILDSGGVGVWTSITIGSDGLGLISYDDYTNGYLKIAHCSSVNCASATLSTLDSGGFVGWYTSITIGSDGLGLIGYYDVNNQDLKVAHCSNVNCSAATLSTLDSIGNVGRHTSITIGADGLGLISYQDLTNGDLKVAHCSNALCTPYVRRR